MPKMGILKRELTKEIVEFGIITSEYIFVRLFILNKALRILGAKFKKIIVGFKISSPEYPFVSRFTLNEALSIFGTKFA